MNTEQLKKFSALDFNPEKYVKDISQVTVGGQELQAHRAKIQLLSEETNQALKKNVYKYYMQFIETAREISHLEGEMYQLSHLLSEQRALLASMSSSGSQPSLSSGLTKAQEENRLAALNQLQLTIENCPELSNSSDRELLHEGDLVELEPLENTALHRGHVFLLTDILITTVWISDRKGPAKYKFESEYDLGSLAVVNVRDLGQVKHAFKLLVFPDTRLFQCANSEAKEEWLKKLDEAKKARLSGGGGAKEPSPVPAASAVSPPPPVSAHPPLRAVSLESDSNPFSIYLEETETDTLPEWLLESPDDLDVFIAQRHFEDAYSLIRKSEDYIKTNQENQAQALGDLNSKILERKEKLISVLLSELRVSSEKSLQGGLRASRRAVRLLNLLNKSTQACELYLCVCSNLLKTEVKRVKREGATVAYVKRLAQVYFSNLASITSEFQYRAFPHHAESTSAFVVWVSMEVSNFMSHFMKQVYIPQTPLGTLAECIHIIRDQSKVMCELGVDLSYQVNGQSMSAVTRAVAEAGEKAMDAIKLRAAEDTWRPSRQTPQSLNKIQAEINLPLNKYFTSEGWFQLTGNTLSFVKLFASLLDEALTISCPELDYSLANVFREVFDTQLRHLSASYSNNKYASQRSIIPLNAEFLLEIFLESCQKKYKEKMGHRCKGLDLLKKDFAFLLKD